MCALCSKRWRWSCCLRERPPAPCGDNDKLSERILVQHQEVEETGGCRLRTGHLLAPMAQIGRETPSCPELSLTVPMQGPARAAPPARAKVPSSHSARHGPRSRGGKTPRSPRKAPRGRPRQAGVSARAGSGRAPRPSWSCCSGCACWWTAGSGLGSGCGDDGTESVRGPASSLGSEQPPHQATGLTTVTTRASPAMLEVSQMCF